MKLLLVLAFVLALGLAEVKAPEPKAGHGDPPVPEPEPEPEPDNPGRPGPYIVGRVTCDNRVAVFSDGKQVSVPNSNTWTRSGVVRLPFDTRVLGIRCKSTRGNGGIKAAFDNSVKTDSSWKCSDQREPGWANEGFDDSAWEDATIPGYNIYRRLPLNLAGTSDWIWTSRVFGRRTVFCRKEFPPTTYNCQNRNPCTNLTPDDIANHRFYYPHNNEESFIQCSAHGQCYRKTCPGGTVWNQDVRTCVHA